MTNDRDLSDKKSELTAWPISLLFCQLSLSIFFSFGMAIFSSLGNAQDDSSTKPAPPSPPFVGVLSGDYVFTKAFTYKQQQEDPNETKEQKDVQAFLTSRFPTLKEVDSKETGNVREDKQVFTSGLSQEIWRVDLFRLTVYSNSPDSISVTTFLPGQSQDPPDFPELTWVNRSLFQDVETLQGKPCYVYKSGDQTAWIDKSTRLPVFFDSKAMQVTYTYKTPDEPLQLPDKLAKKLQAAQRP